MKQVKKLIESICLFVLTCVFRPAVSFNFFFICNLAMCSAFLVYIMSPGTNHKARCAIGTVCYACGKQFAMSYEFDQHSRSGYLIGTRCHVLDDGSTCSLLVALNTTSEYIQQHKRICPQPCFRHSRQSQSTTVHPVHNH
jgi:hypothetical protein